MKNTYSQSLISVVKAMLSVDSNTRPSCSQILDTDYVKEKCQEFGINLDDDTVAAYDSNNQSAQ